MDDLISRQPEQRTLTEDDYAYCTECDHVEMCRWYPMYGCEFKSRPSAQPEYNYCRECKWSRCHINADKYGNTGTYWWCIYWCGETDEEGFCHNWERRTDE